VLPSVATFPSNRLLVIPGLGALTAAVLVVRHLWTHRGWRPAGLVSGLSAVLLVLLHGVLAVPTWAGLAWMLKTGVARAEQNHQAVVSELDPAGAPNRHVVTLMSDPLSSLTVAANYALKTQRFPKSWRLLSMAQGDHVFTRSGPATLDMELASPDKRLLESEPERFLRAPPLPMPRSETLSGMRIDVVASDDRGIQRLRFTFEVPLDDPSLVFLHWENNVLRPLRIPPPGTRWTEHPPSAF